MREAWRTLAEKALGADLMSAEAGTADGIVIRPLYDRERREDRPRPWRANAAWSVSQRVDHPDASQANKAALLDLEGGADALTLVFETSPYARGFGLPLDSASLDAALAGIELDFIGLRLDAGPGTAVATGHLRTLVETRRLTSAGLRVDLGFDPIGFTARGVSANPDDLAEILDHATKAGLRGCPVLADGRPYHEAGASEAQELAAILATGVAYLRRLETHGFSRDRARRTIAFQLAVDADFFLGLAKTRALRRLWSRVEDASGLTPEPMCLHAETAWRMMTRRDPWMNVMRATAATVAAGLGGADIIDVLPFTLTLGLPDDDARRLARNIQRVLLDEANLGKVEDPAAGAGGFEALTDALCEEAWREFQALEREGGISEALRTGTLRARLAATARSRARRFATLCDGIIGTNRFPSLTTPAPDVLDVPPRTTDSDLEALPCSRDGAPFEALRDGADAMGTRPRMFLATLGTPAAFGARATYAANFFAVAGIAALSSMIERDMPAIVSDFVTSGLHVACLCGTDAAYAEHATTIADALRRSGASRIILVGTPGSHEGVWRQAGIDDFGYDGCPALDVLGRTLRAIENGASEANGEAALDAAVLIRERDRT